MHSNIAKLVRKNILNLKPYSSARDEFKGKDGTFFDANENPYENGYNRYPDPRQLQLKAAVSKIKNVPVENIFLGNGSDEAIDLLFRAFCEPGVDNVVIPQPSYGMYEVSADIQNISMRKPLLNTDFSLNIPAILDAQDEHSKLLFLCSPNNPTGNLFAKEDVLFLLENFNGLVVVDEAYIDFTPEKSMTTILAEYANLVVLQTFSKAWGLAGMRLGMAFASTDVIGILNKVKAPYNINILTQREALKALAQIDTYETNLQEIIAQRSVVIDGIKAIDYVQNIYPSDANFILVKVEQPKELYKFLTDKGLVVRDRSNTVLCDGCLRITIGAPQENIELINAMKQFATA